MLLVELLDCNIRICHSSRVVVHNVMRAVMLLSIDLQGLLHVWLQDAGPPAVGLRAQGEERPEVGRA